MTADTHEVAVARLREAYAAWPPGTPVRLAKHTSNLFRPRTRWIESQSTGRMATHRGEGAWPGFRAPRPSARAPPCASQYPLRLTDTSSGTPGHTG